MRAYSTTCKVLAWVFMAIYSVLQMLAIYGISQQNKIAVANGRADRVYPPAPLVIATVLMLVAVLLFFVIRKKRLFGVLLGFAAAVMMLVVALDLGRSFPVTVGSYDVDTGLSTAKLITRHIGIVIVPILLSLAWLFEHYDNQAIAAAEAARERADYDFSGSPVFKDDDYSMLPEQQPKKLKRSIKKKLERQDSNRDD